MLRDAGFSERAIFVIDKAGVVRYVDVHDISKQPDNEVLFNVLAEIEPNWPQPMTRPRRKRPRRPNLSPHPWAK